MKFLPALICLGLSACAVTLDRTAWTQAWPEGLALERLDVTPLGAWYQADLGYQLGEYGIEAIDPSWWDSSPQASEISISVAGIGIGAQEIHDESTFSFRVTAQGADLGVVKCQQFLHVENWRGGAHDNWGSIIIGSNMAYLATLNCASEGFHPDWPQDWRLDLRAVDLRPFFGQLKFAQKSWTILGTQDAEIARYDESTGFEIRDGNEIRGRLDMLRKGFFEWPAEAELSERLALLATAGSLLLANDPLAP